MLKKFALPMTLAGLCATYTATAAVGDGRWTTTIWAGPLFTPQRTMQPGASGAIENIGSLDSTLAGDSGTTTVDRLSFRDVFRTGEALGAELAYRSGGNFEPFARLSFTRLGGKSVRVGELTSEALTAAAPVNVNFDEAKSAAITLGGRYFFAESGALHPFVTAFVGADHMDAVHADVAVVQLESRFDRQNVLPNTTRFQAGAEAGVSYQLGNSADLRFAIGAERVSAQRFDSKFLEPLGIDAIRISERRWSIPAEIGLNYRF
jgi:hypothetical protein